jgi:hypothetical protein
VATPRRLRHHVGVFRSVPAYMHEAMVAAYVRDATFAPMDDETLARRGRLGARGRHNPSYATTLLIPKLNFREILFYEVR